MNQKGGGQVDIIHFLNFEYFKNYAKHEKSENIFIFKEFFFKFSKKKISKKFFLKKIFFWIFLKVFLHILQFCTKSAPLVKQLLKSINWNRF